MQKVIRIGTRDSELALWQANKVQRMLNELGYETKIITNTYDNHRCQNTDLRFYNKKP